MIFTALKSEFDFVSWELRTDAIDAEKVGEEIDGAGRGKAPSYHRRRRQLHLPATRFPGWASVSVRPSNPNERAPDDVRPGSNSSVRPSGRN